MVKKRIFIVASLLLLATPYCHARGYTLDDANHIIVILIVLVLALIGCGAYSLYYNRKICQRNEQLRRILTALDDYRAMVADDVFSLDDQEAYLQHQLEKPKSAKVEKRDAKQNFFVMMDARVTKEKPFTDPDFDHEALVKFMGVSDEAFCQLVPRYSDRLWASAMRRSVSWCRAIVTQKERSTTSTPYGQNMLRRYSWSTQTTLQKT